jgi:hypothetical protein
MMTISFNCQKVKRKIISFLFFKKSDFERQKLFIIIVPIKMVVVVRKNKRLSPGSFETRTVRKKEKKNANQKKDFFRLFYF